MSNGNPIKVIRTNDVNVAALSTLEAEQYRQIIDDLFLRVDHEAELLRNTTADLLNRVSELDKVTQSKQMLEALVVQLRDANQNLVLATFGAQDRQAEAETAKHRQEEFLAMLAHELRNPLAPISMAADLLGKIITAHPMLPKLHGIISRQVNLMARLIEDLLDASRVSTGNISLQKCSLQLAEVIESAVETSQPFIDKRNQQLSIHLTNEPIMINGDLVRLAQVFSNLLINASKFTPVDEHIDISVKKLPNKVSISIKDNGVGIAPEVQPIIFELFRQGPRSPDRSQSGLGIGLSLVRSIVQMHDGIVSVYSAGVGLGSEFIVELPISNELN